MATNFYTRDIVRQIRHFSYAILCHSKGGIFLQNGLLISEIRTKLGLSQLDMAKKLGITLAAYKSYEANLRPMKIQELDFLSNYFRVSLNALLGFTHNLRVLGSAPIDYKYLRFSLRYIRRIHRITQKKLAHDLQVSLPLIGYFEKHPETLKADYLYKFAKYFHVSVDYICGKTLKKEVL